MLTRWSIENFKSFNGRTELEFAPITIFAGANSSGKSSIIQSILIIKQTLQYAATTRPIALNGPLLKLGTFNDIKSYGSTAPHIGIGWSIQSREVFRTQLIYGPNYLNYGRWDIKQATSEVRFDVSRQDLAIGAVLQEDQFQNQTLLQLQPSLSYSSLTSISGSEHESRGSPQGEHTAFVSIQRIKAELTSPVIAPKKTLPSKEGGLLRYDVSSLDDDSRVEVLEQKQEAKIIGARTRHFFPAQLAIQYDAARERARRVAELICSAGSGPGRHLRELAEFKVSPEIQTLVLEHLSKDMPRPQGSLFADDLRSVPLGDFLETLRRLRSSFHRPALSAGRTILGSIGPSLAELQPTIEQILSAQAQPEIAVENAWARQNFEAVQFMSQYFTHFVRYLGPLRDEPKPIYPLEAIAAPTEVGYRGEHTAAVLDLNRETVVDYIPSSFIADGNVPALTQRGRLHDAVVDWLKYLGVADEVWTTDQGKFGHQLQVQTSDLAKMHDLTNVGVGVSQVLPIIVMALLAPPPSLLIFEQPELHLHPRVQARLADFFLSVSLQGKQCLLETHSEYLIERLRRRIAEAEGDSLTDSLRIYFVERLAGQTKCRPVEVTRYGAIKDWPKDFFDQAESETEQILAAAVRKRSAERDKKKS